MNAPHTPSPLSQRIDGDRPEPTGDRGVSRWTGLFGLALLALYRGVGRAAEPVAGAVLDRRARRGKESGPRRAERFGRPGAPRPPGPVVWVHAASVGETISVLPLIARLEDLGLGVLLTTGTVTSATIAERDLGDKAIHQFVPIDTPGAVTRFLDHWRPDLALFTESELWPTMLMTLRQRGVRLVLVNARLSNRSSRRWGLAPPAARAVMGSVDLVLAQTIADARRFRDLGATHVEVSGNMKFDAPQPFADPAAVAALRDALGGRPVLLAASTHPGEEAIVIAAHAALARSVPSLLTIIAPRHPDRGAEVAAAVAAAGMVTARRSQGAPIAPATDIYVADTIGEMGLWYRVAGAAFLGGSLAPQGGQNPIEPAKLGVPILHGPHVGNFADVYQMLADAGAVTTVTEARGLAEAAARMLNDPAAAERAAREARACVERSTGAIERTLVALEPDLAPLRTGGHAHADA